MRSLPWLRLGALLILAGVLASAMPALAGPAHDHPGEYDTIAQLWEGIDPRAEPLEIKVLDSWTSEGITYTRLYFTSEYWEGEPVRVYAIQGAPMSATPGTLPGILHIHGGGQTVNLEWVTFWARRGYACVTFDYCGDWTAHEPARTTFTQWGRYAGGMQQMGRWMRPNARHDPWFHWAVMARRALTLLEQHPACDPQRLGVFGISMGGTLTWLVAATDSRVKAAVPIYGCGWNTYDSPEQTPETPVKDPDVLAWRELLQPESYAPLIRIPLLFINATQDFHGQMDRCECTLDLLDAPVKRQVYTPRTNHHIEPREGRSLPLWMDWHLKGEGEPWPQTPQLAFAEREGQLELVLTPDHPEEVERVEINYALNNRYPTGRFWRVADAARRDAQSWIAPAPFFDVEDTLFAFANVTYRSGVTLSSRLQTQVVAEWPAVGPALEWSEQIDTMEDDQAWFYVPGYTDPQFEWSYLIPWQGAESSRGFTLDPHTIQAEEYVLNIATHKLGDPQWRGKPGFSLALDAYNPRPFTQLTLKVIENDGQPNRREYTVEISPQPTEGAWRTIFVEPGAFKASDGQALTSWEAVDTLNLAGKTPANAPPVFRNLRWLRH